jgi:hypothetical protein
MSHLLRTLVLSLLATAGLTGLLRAEPARADATWRQALVDHLASDPATAVAKTLARFPDDRLQLEIAADWLAQDRLIGASGVQVDAIGAVLDELGAAGKQLRQQFEKLQASSVPTTDPRWTELYLDACQQRREARLAIVRKQAGKIVFTKHYDMGGSHYAYTEGQSDAQAERHFKPGTSLCLLELGETLGTVRTLLDDAGGVIRDPDVSFDGERILFAWKKSLNEDDYHLYEMNAADGKVRQITSGLGFADYEGAYMPGGNIVFTSTRCVQTVDCWWTEVSHLYTCDAQGRYLRRLAFDQVHTNYPTLTWDGRVVYTRWEYSDRGQIYPQGLFHMNPDGTAQQELYGNSSWFPTSILHPRAIPGTQKIVGIFSGHHTKQRGWLGIIDPARGRQENSGAQLIAPVRETPAVRIDAFGQSGDQFQYPYPLSETEFVVAFRPEKAPHFGIYFVTADGRRELLASDPKISCNQPVPLVARPEPPVRSNQVDYRQQTGVVYMRDVYAGDALKGVAPGTIKSLRVVALEHRAAGVGNNGNGGPAGGALVCTPISIQGAWDVKHVLGSVKVHEDGSAAFELPARTPVYFQALDEKGRAVQTMRSWLTVQPGEKVSCVGCHDNKNAAPPTSHESFAMRLGPQKIKPWRNQSAGGFSFASEVQPVLNNHCVRCHHRDGNEEFPEKPVAFSLEATQTFEPGSLRKWSDGYKGLANRKWTNWLSPQSIPSILEPYHAGAAVSPLIEMLEQGHHDVQLSAEELDSIATWIDLAIPFCGDYRDGLEGKHLEKYQHFLDKRLRWEAQEAQNIEDYLRDHQ